MGTWCFCTIFYSFYPLLFRIQGNVEEGVETRFLKQATERMAGFKLRDFSQHLRSGISVLDGLFFFMGVEKVLESVPTLYNLEKGKKKVFHFQNHANSQMPLL